MRFPQLLFAFGSSLLRFPAFGLVVWTGQHFDGISCHLFRSKDIKGTAKNEFPLCSPFFDSLVP